MTKIVKNAGRNRYNASQVKHAQRQPMPRLGAPMYTGADHTQDLQRAAGADGHNCRAYGPHEHAADGSPVPVGQGVRFCARCGHTRAAHFSGEDCVKADCTCPGFVAAENSSASG